MSLLLWRFEAYVVFGNNGRAAKLCHQLDTYFRTCLRLQTSVDCYLLQLRLRINCVDGDLVAALLCINVRVVVLSLKLERVSVHIEVAVEVFWLLRVLVGVEG